MLQKQAEDIASNWHYEGKYSFYDVSADEEEFLNPKERGNTYYIVKTNEKGIGLFSFDDKGDSVDIGLGMKPELTGKRLGLDFLKA